MEKWILTKDRNTDINVDTDYWQTYEYWHCCHAPPAPLFIVVLLMSWQDQDKPLSSSQHYNATQSFSQGKKKY